jgi:hypothetical protein
VEIDHPYTGPLKYPGAQFKMSETPYRAGRAPLLGEHTDSVLIEKLVGKPDAPYIPDIVPALADQTFAFAVASTGCCEDLLLTA